MLLLSSGLERAFQDNKQQTNPDYREDKEQPVLHITEKTQQIPQIVAVPVHVGSPLLQSRTGRWFCSMSVHRIRHEVLVNSAQMIAQTRDVGFTSISNQRNELHKIGRSPSRSRRRRFVVFVGHAGRILRPAQIEHRCCAHGIRPDSCPAVAPLRVRRDVRSCGQAHLLKC
jgi:hypothetical protein